MKSETTPWLLGGAAIAAWYFWTDIQAWIAPWLPAAATPANPVLTATVTTAGPLDPTVSNDPTALAQSTAQLLASQGYSPTQQAIAAQQAATAATINPCPAGQAYLPQSPLSTSPPQCGPLPWAVTNPGQPNPTQAVLVSPSSPIRTAPAIMPQAPPAAIARFIPVLAAAAAAIPNGGPAIYGPSINGQPPSMTMAQYQAWQLNTLAATAAATPPPSYS